MLTVTKEDLAEGIYRKAFPFIKNLEHKQCGRFVPTALETILELLRKGEGVRFKGLGVLFKAPVAEKIMHNPRTLEPVRVPKHYKIRLSSRRKKDSKVLNRKALNKEVFKAVQQKRVLLTQTETTELLALMFDLIETYVAMGCRLEFRGFGVFSLLEVTIENTRNPKTGECVGERTTKRAKFQASSIALKEKEKDHERNY